MIDCESCAVSKAHEIVLRRLPADKATRPFYCVHIDLFLEIVAYNGDNYIIHFFDEFSQMNEVEIFA